MESGKEQDPHVESEAVASAQRAQLVTYSRGYRCLNHFQFLKELIKIE